jgi:hypothetical protein
MREIITIHIVPLQKLLWSFGINAIFLVVVFAFFCRILRAVKRRGLLAKIGE